MKIIENTPSSRMQLRGVGELMHPGICAVCGSGTNLDGYIDIGVYYDYEGQVYLCTNCVSEAGQILGMAIPYESEFLRKQVEELTQQNLKLKDALEQAHERINLFESLFKLDSSSSDVVDGDTVEDSLITEQGEPEGSQGNVKRGKSSLAVVSESAEDDGSDDAGKTEPRNRSLEL